MHLVPVSWSDHQCAYHPADSRAVTMAVVWSPSTRCGRSNARRCWIVPNSRPLTPMGEGLIPREKPRAALAHQPSDLQSAQPRRLQFRAEEIPKIVVSPLMVRGYGVRAGPARRKSFNTNRLRQFFRANNVPKVFYLFLGKSAKIPEYARGTPKKCSYIYRGQL